MISVDAAIPRNGTNGMRPGCDQHIKNACHVAAELLAFVRARYTERYGDVKFRNEHSPLVTDSAREHAMWDEILGMATAVDGLMRLAAESRKKKRPKGY